jgi:hypothetical protein
VALVEGDASARGRALARERELWDAYVAVDTDRLERLVDPLALDVGPAGPRTRTDVLAAVATMTIASYEIADLSIAVDGDLEIVTYRATVDGSYRGATFTDREIWAASIWHCGDASARLVHRHETPARPRA